jgi:arylsulfatase A-like enzyme
MPFLTAKEQAAPHEFLFWRLMPAAAVRSGKWKLMRPAQPGQPTRLYDLEADPAEKTDVAAANPDAVKRLAEALARWESQLVAPKWEPAAPKDGVIHDSATGKRIGRVRGQK